jgi:hypothetical protein
MPYGNSTAGTGTITTYSNNAIIGSGTIFKTELTIGSILRNSANVYIGRVSNVTSNTSANLVTSSFTGSGTLEAFTGNVALVGHSTYFISQLSVGATIKNASGTTVGTVANIGSNTSANLTTNGVVAIANSTYTVVPTLLSGAGFRYNQYTLPANVYTANVSYNTGTVTTLSSNSYIIGSGTRFVSELNPGYSLYGNTDYANSFIGSIAMVVTDNIAIMTGNAITPVSGIKYISDNLKVRSETHAGALPFGFEQINAALYNWSRSGLIGNVPHIKSYHPPIQDPVTGIMVNFPATVYHAPNIANVITHTQGNIDSTGAYDARGGSVTDFNTDDRFFGNDLYNVYQGTANVNIINDLTGVATDNNHYSNLVPMLYAPTPIDTLLTKLPNTPNALPRVTDDLNDAKNYLSAKPLAERLTLDEKLNIMNNNDSRFRFKPPTVDELNTTGVPVAVPGVLNATYKSYEENAKKKWTPYEETPVVPQKIDGAF